MRVIQCIVAAVLLTGVLSCGKQHNSDVRAHIVERRIDANGRLLVRYQFKKGGALVMDSAEFEEQTVVPHDSVPVVFSSKNASEHRLLLP